MPKSKTRNQVCTECIHTTNSSIRITRIMLEKLIAMAKETKKTPYLILGIKRNEKETFLLKSILTIEKSNK